MHILIDHLRQFVRAGGDEELAVLLIEIGEGNDSEHPVHRRADRPPTLVVAVRRAAFVARRAHIGDEGSQMRRLTEQALNGVNDGRDFSNRGQTRFGQFVSADRVFRRFRVLQRRRVGIDLRMVLDDTPKLVDFVGRQDIAHNQIAVLLVVGYLLLA